MGIAGSVERIGAEEVAALLKKVPNVKRTASAVRQIDKAEAAMMH